MKIRAYVFAGIIMGVFLFTRLSFGADIEGLLEDSSDWLNTTLIPKASVLGIGIGGAMSAFGSQFGIQIVKWSVIGGIIGFGGAQTIKGLLF